MEISEFILELRAIIDEKYPNLKIIVRKDNDHSFVAIGFIKLASSFAIDIKEFEKTSKRRRLEIIKTRIIDMLNDIQNMINYNIEKIENAKTQDS